MSDVSRIPHWGRCLFCLRLRNTVSYMAESWEEVAGALQGGGVLKVSIHSEPTRLTPSWILMSSCRVFFFSLLCNECNIVV